MYPPYRVVLLKWKRPLRSLYLITAVLGTC
ncbi:hypothetical protein EDF87_104116 [Pseudomonas helmanticensis]|uniref:Uncharacterized protein n=1 Tax=Pseudomonas helmanticensis TaxID=1471381 RepID=A0A4R7VJ66_9PSED|nr:hypothetical protein EDF87_104116 [Pseudomonas helmanticensis]